MLPLIVTRYEQVACVCDDARVAGPGCNLAHAAPPAYSMAAHDHGASIHGNSWQIDARRGQCNERLLHPFRARPHDAVLMHRAGFPPCRPHIAANPEVAVFSAAAERGHRHRPQRPCVRSLPPGGKHRHRPQRPCVRSLPPRPCSGRCVMPTSPSCRLGCCECSGVGKTEISSAGAKGH